MAEKAWSFEEVVDETERYWTPKEEEMAARKARLRREREDAMFAAALA